nr:hypothetical protein GCM10020093_028730 [Planobispora longispora]
MRPGWRGWLRDDTPVCRCEEVPLAAVREALELGATDARSVKLLSRAGMGWCQGRMCGYAVSCLAGGSPAGDARAGAGGQGGGEARPGAGPAAFHRPIAQPVRLGDLAGTAAEPPRPGPPGTPAEVSHPPTEG